jgi:hypothetical protein
MRPCNLSRKAKSLGLLSRNVIAAQANDLLSDSSATGF